MRLPLHNRERREIIPATASFQAKLMASPMPVFILGRRQGCECRRGIAQEKGAADTEALRHPMVDGVVREPVELPNLDLHVFDGPPAHILELQGVGVLGLLVAPGPDQPQPPLAGHGEDDQEIGLVEINMQLAVERRP